MKILAEEINKFFEVSGFSDGTIKIYSKRLQEFVEYLSVETNTKVCEIHLKKVYVIVDIKGKIIGFKPIDSKLIDKFFSKNINKGHNWISEARKAIGSFFKYLNRTYDFKNIMDSTSFNFKQYRKERNYTNILSRHDLLKLFHSIVSNSKVLKRDLLLFTLLITTGSRISEILNIKIRDINWNEETIILPLTKNREQRIIILRPDISEAIKKYTKEYGIEDNDYLFNLNYSQVSYLLKSFLKKVNLERVNIHSLRHSFATLMYESNTDITLIKQMLGHNDIEVTRNYIHPNYLRNRNLVIKENDFIFNNIKILSK
ncbi:tyrosine-type recombinase/integrase [Fredinandcohnia humi]